MTHQHAQGDRRIGIARIAHRVSQIGADILVRVEQAVVHHLHQADARHQFGHRRAAEIGIFFSENSGHFHKQMFGNL